MQPHTLRLAPLPSRAVADDVERGPKMAVRAGVISRRGTPMRRRRVNGDLMLPAAG